MIFLLLFPSIQITGTEYNLELLLCGFISEMKQTAALTLGILGLKAVFVQLNEIMTNIDFESGDFNDLGGTTEEKTLDCP